MDSVYIVLQKSVKTYIPEPMGQPFTRIPRMPETPRFPQMPNYTHIPRMPNLTTSNFLEPRFDDIMPPFNDPFSTLKLPTSDNNINIVCLCKDLDTATHYKNMSKDRYILGPYKIM